MVTERTASEESQISLNEGDAAIVELLSSAPDVAEERVAVPEVARVIGYGREARHQLRQRELAVLRLGVGALPGRRASRDDRQHEEEQENELTATRAHGMPTSFPFLNLRCM